METALPDSESQAEKVWGRAMNNNYCPRSPHAVPVLSLFYVEEDVKINPAGCSVLHEHSTLACIANLLQQQPLGPSGYNL